ncbi:DUF896 domain-containing protein [Cohnella nanjingensis]|uniref:UPF0291 protein H7C19_00520 n=1 Tax=Cohnella nanjingensis TaxID=1387779 RepID=A0A7X0RKV2_9BACL|nr:DUF896 domain-containing protein [Cohnella nanjingensis]MBB6669163.1 DUF896 domain-containing protein [Cohnella nanjingensis]
MDRLIARINELAKKHKTVGLNEEETLERQALRKQYLEIFKRNFRQELDRIEFTDEPPKNDLKH